MITSETLNASHLPKLTDKKRMPHVIKSTRNPDEIRVHDGDTRRDNLNGQGETKEFTSSSMRPCVIQIGAGFKVVRQVRLDNGGNAPKAAQVLHQMDYKQQQVSKKHEKTENIDAKLKDRPPFRFTSLNHPVANKKYPYPKKQKSQKLDVYAKVSPHYAPPSNALDGVRTDAHHHNGLTSKHLRDLETREKHWVLQLTKVRARDLQNINPKYPIVLGISQRKERDYFRAMADTIKRPTQSTRQAELLPYRFQKTVRLYCNGNPLVLLSKPVVHPLTQRKYLSLKHPKADTKRKSRVAGHEIEPVMMGREEFGAQSSRDSQEIELEFDFIGQDLDATSESEFAPLEATPDRNKRIGGPEIEPVMAEQDEFPDELPEETIENLERHAEQGGYDDDIGPVSEEGDERGDAGQSEPNEFSQAAQSQEQGQEEQEVLGEQSAHTERSGTPETEFASVQVSITHQQLQNETIQHPKDTVDSNEETAAHDKQPHAQVQD